MKKANDWLRSAGSDHRLARTWLIALAIVTTGLWLHAHRDLPWRVWSGDAAEYADMARRISSGEGFTTGVIYPAELHLGTDREHPATMRPPLWPLLLAPAFWLAGPEPAAVHGVLLVFLVGTVLCAAGLAATLAGRWAGLVAGVATASSAPFTLHALDGLSETAFAFWIALAFLLEARGSRAVWLGLCCGAAYLTRYNGALLLPIFLLLLWQRPGGGRQVAACIAGFTMIVLPWWLRNLWVAGSPLYSLLNLNLYFSPDVTQMHSSLYYMIEPDLQGPAAMSPWVKLRVQLPELLRLFPPASASLAAFLGVLLAGLRRDRLCLAWLAVVAATLVTVSAALVRGRYFVPFLPPMLALGAAGWALHGGRLAVPALTLLLAAPWLPSLPSETPDIRLLRQAVVHERQAARTRPELADARKKARDDLRRCLDARSLIVAERAAEITWQTDAVSIYKPATATDFWRLLDEHPVQFVQIEHWRDVSREELEDRFRRRPECGPGFYERRSR